jgi:hypothetical protein
MPGSRPEPTPTTPLDPAAQQIATALGETEPVPLMHIRRIVQQTSPRSGWRLRVIPMVDP